VRIENSYIPVRGVGEETERRLWAAGARRWGSFDPSLVGPTTADRIESFIAEAGERLDDGDARYFGEVFPANEQWRLYENFRETTCFFDIETTGLDAGTSVVTTVSFHRDGETTTLVRGEDLTAERVREQVDEADLLATFNGRRFDVPFLESALGVAPDLPHVDLMYACRRLGLSGGLKEVERDLGVERDRPDISGRDAVRLWREYERGDDGALDTLVSYNRDDAANLATLMERVAADLHDATVGDVDG
jgi:uncharacterized protein YprB with RNaseH-like and TPR domain